MTGPAGRPGVTGPSDRHGSDPVRWPKRAAAPGDRRRRDELRRRLRVAVLDRAAGIHVSSFPGSPGEWIGLDRAIDLAVVEYELLLEALGPLAALTDEELIGL